MRNEPKKIKIESQNKRTDPVKAAGQNTWSRFCRTQAVLKKIKNYNKKSKLWGN